MSLTSGGLPLAHPSWRRWRSTCPAHTVSFSCTSPHVSHALPWMRMWCHVYDSAVKTPQRVQCIYIATVSGNIWTVTPLKQSVWNLWGKPFLFKWGQARHPYLCTYMLTKWSIYVLCYSVRIVYWLEFGVEPDKSLSPLPLLLSLRLTTLWVIQVVEMVQVVCLLWCTYTHLAI